MAMKTLSIMAMLAGAAAAQTAPFQPSYVVGAGVLYNYWGRTIGTVPAPGFSGDNTFGARLGSTNVYSYSSINLTAQTAAFSTGAAYVFKQSGNWSLAAIGTAGLVTGSGSAILGQFMAGGMVFYDIGQRLKPGTSAHYYIVGRVNLMNVTSQTVQPVYGIGLAAGF